MNPELFMVVLPAVSWFLFALGGTQISDEIEGWKGWRRFILPAVFMAACLIARVVIWKAFLVTGLAVGAFSLGYGEEKPYTRKALVGLSYALISIPIGISVWNLLTFPVFLGLLYLSNFKPTSWVFIWKICEGFFGLFCGIQLAYSLMGRGIIW